MALGPTEVALGMAAGALSTLSPCVFPLLPLVVGGASQGNRLTPLWMGLGMVGTFALGGLLLGTVGDTIGLDADLLRTVGASLMLAMAVVMLNQRLTDGFTRWVSPVANAGNALSSRLQGTGALTSLALGGLLGLVWSPCSGPLLASALTLVATEGGAVRGGVILGGFGLGAAIPLMAVAYASRSGVSRAQGWLVHHGASLKQAFAVVIGLSALAVLLGLDKRLEAVVVGALPLWWVELTTRF